MGFVCIRALLSISKLYDVDILIKKKYMFLDIYSVSLEESS